MYVVDLSICRPTARWRDEHVGQLVLVETLLLGQIFRSTALNAACWCLQMPMMATTVEERRPLDAEKSRGESNCFPSSLMGLTDSSAGSERNWARRRR